MIWYHELKRHDLCTKNMPPWDTFIIKTRESSFEIQIRMNVSSQAHRFILGDRFNL